MPSREGYSLALRKNVILNKYYNSDCPPQLVPISGEGGAQYRYCSPSAPVSDAVQACGTNRHCQFSTTLDRYICCGLETDIRLPSGFIFFITLRLVFVDWNLSLWGNCSSSFVDHSNANTGAQGLPCSKRACFRWKGSYLQLTRFV